MNYSPPAIDPAQTSASQQLTGQEVVALPYPTTRDIRNAFPLLPGVLPDNSAPGQVHVAGAYSNQTLYSLDGFDISQPVSGLLDLRVSTDAVRSVDVLTSRYSVDSGWGSGGVLNLETGMGDDHFRFFATDFIPTAQDRRGIHFGNTTPRFTLSGPLWKGKAWFYEAVEGEYDLDIYTELPPGQDADHYWRYSNLTRAQINLTQGNRLTASYLYNHSNEDYAGLSLIQPLSTTTSQIKSADFVSLKDQNTWSNGMLFEAGFGFLQFTSDLLPLGTLPYVQLAGSASGNYYLTSSSTVRRYEGLANLFLPPVEWHGRHEFTLDVAFERSGDFQLAVRQPPLPSKPPRASLSAPSASLAAPPWTKIALPAAPSCRIAGRLSRPCWSSPASVLTKMIFSVARSSLRASPPPGRSPATNRPNSRPGSASTTTALTSTSSHVR